MVNWIDNDSKYRNVQLNHIKTNSEKANSDIWIDAIMMDREDEKERKREGERYQHKTCTKYITWISLYLAQILSTSVDI